MTDNLILDSRFQNQDLVTGVFPADDFFSYEFFQNLMLTVADFFKRLVSQVAGLLVGSFLLALMAVFSSSARDWLCQWLVQTVAGFASGWF